MWSRFCWQLLFPALLMQTPKNLWRVLSNTSCFNCPEGDFHQLTWTLHFGRLNFSGFILTFSLGFGFCSLPELRNFIVAAACLRMQSLLQYTESGCATLEHPGPMHLAAPGASTTCRTKQVTSDNIHANTSTEHCDSSIDGIDHWWLLWSRH